MKGETKLVVTIKDEMGSFPVTETFTIQRDNTYESIEEWIDVFKKVLYVVGFTDRTINELFGGHDE